MTELCNLLTDSLTEALETMAFLDVMSPDEDSSIPEERILGEIKFSGPKNGGIEILAGIEFTKTLAENFAAIDDPDEESCIDALKELCNVVSGLLLPALVCSETDVFDVTVPTTASNGNSPGWDEFTEDSNCCVLNIEGHLVAVKVVMKN